MSRKNFIKGLQNSEHKERYKAYKSNKTWIYATITGFLGVLGGGATLTNVAHADNTLNSDNKSKEVDSSNRLVSQNKATIPAETDNYALESTKASQATVSISSAVAQGQNKVDFNGYYVYRTYIDSSTKKGIELLAQVDRTNSTASIYIVGIDMSSGKAVASGAPQPLSNTAGTINDFKYGSKQLITTANTHLVYTSKIGDEDDISGVESQTYTYPDSLDLKKVTVRYVDENGTEINAPESKVFLTNVKILTNATDVGVFEKYEITNIPQTINGLKYSNSEGDLSGTNSGTVTLAYKVDQASISDSESTSDSMSESISNSESTSDSTSDSQSMSDSMSESISSSESTSDSISGSDSMSESISSSESTSDSISGSDSMSESISSSESASDSMSESISSSESASDSISESISSSESASDSMSESISSSESASDSMSESISSSESASDSMSESISSSESASDSMSESISSSESASDSMSESISSSESASDSMSESISSSESTSDATNNANGLAHNNSLPNTGMVDESSLQIFGELVLLLALLGIKRRK